MSEQQVAIHGLDDACGPVVGPRVAACRELLARKIGARSGLGVRAAPNAAAAQVVLGIDPTVAGPEGYRIAGAPGEAVRVLGHDGRGLVYGIGKLLRSSHLAPGVFAPGPWRGESTPVKPVRGMYFASHFHNFYHDAPVAEVVAYIEDLALWGCNTLSVWFDMHHYRGMRDPAAQAMVARLRALLEAAHRVGMGAALTSLANEGFADSPEPLRAEWRSGQNGYFRDPGGHYHVEICPKKTGGLEEILRERAEMLDAFAGIPIDYFWIWPYDQGGCTCAHCAPWGANGFLHVAEPVAKLVRTRCPEAKIILSTWYFDHFIKGEWAAFDQAIAACRPAWVDYLLIDDFGGFPRYPLEHGVPGGFPVVSFAEISMQGMNPWGGIGANPRPRHWQAYWNSSKALVSGGFPYSEGIYEDLNKVLTLQWGWDPELPWPMIVHEYAAAHFDAGCGDELVALVEMLEDDHGFHAQANPGGGAPTYRIGALSRAEECVRLAATIERKLPPALRTSWRWRILQLRAQLDAALKRTNGQPSETIDAGLAELIEIYSAQNADPWVRPPLAKA